MNARKTAARKIAGTLATMATKEQILASFVTHIDKDGEDEREYTYLDKETQRDFCVRRSETLDDQNRSCFRFFLEEYVPSGRLCETNEKGHCIRAWDEPLIKEAEARVGPNGLVGELGKLGVDTSKMISAGGGYGLGSIFRTSLEECAEAIALALLNNERYQYFQPLSDQEKVKLERRSAVQSHQYWESEAAISKYSWDTQEGLFKGCYNGLNQPLDDDRKIAILAYLNAPGHNAWLEVRSIIIAGHKTLWAAWCDNDAHAPRSGHEGYPSADALRDAIRRSAEKRLAEIDEKRQGTAPTGLKLIP